MKTFFDIIFIITVLTLIVINLRTMLLLNSIIFPGFIVAVVVRIVLVLVEATSAASQTPLLFLSSSPIVATILDSLVGAFVGCGALWLVNKIWCQLRGVEVIGYGDMKMLGMIGAYLGILNTVGVLFCGVILTFLSLATLNAITKGKFSFLPSGAIWGVPAISFTLINVNQIIVWLSQTIK